MPRVPVNIVSALSANTTRAGVLLGTPVTTAIAANSLAISNTVQSGDIAFYANRSGNSEEYLFIDGSAGQLKLTSPADNLLINTKLLNKTVRLNSITDSTTTSGDLIGFQSKPRTGVAGTQSVYGCQISAQISDAIALTGSGSIIGGHVDVFVRGTSAGTIAGDVRGLQIELTTDDAGTRNITGYVTGLRIRKAFSAGTVTGKQSAIRIEKPEVQTGSENYDGAFEFTGAGSDMWSDDPTTELNNPGGTVKGYIKVIVNNAARYIALYEKGNLAD